MLKNKPISSRCYGRIRDVVENFVVRTSPSWNGTFVQTCSLLVGKNSAVSWPKNISLRIVLSNDTPGNLFRTMLQPTLWRHGASLTNQFAESRRYVRSTKRQPRRPTAEIQKREYEGVPIFFLSCRHTSFIFFFSVCRGFPRREGNRNRKLKIAVVGWSAA